MTLVYGRVPHPSYRKMIVPKPQHYGSGFGYDYVPGGRKIVGTVQHQTGSKWDTPESIYRLFGPGGERYGDALTDYVTGKDGELWMLNEPEGNRAGWASGGGVELPGGLEGDGPAFYAKWGAWGINVNLVSNENCFGFDEERLTDAQIQKSGQLEAYWHDRAKCPWDTYPLNPNQGGIVYSFLHFEFGTTSCGKTMLDDITRIQAVARGIMKAKQTGEDSGPIKPQVPPQPDPEIPGGLTLEEARERFGELEVHLPDGRVVKRGFDPKGPISLTWAHRAAKDKFWPAADKAYFIQDRTQELNIVTFHPGAWVMIRKSPRHAFVWV